MAFEYAYDLAGNTYPVIREFDIATSTAIKKGEPVVITAGKIVGAGAAPSAILGIAAEAHDGSTAGRQVGTRIKVYCSPTAVYRTKAKAFAATSDGSTTTFVTTGLATPGNDALNAGYIKFKTATNNPIINVVAEITDFATTSGTVTTGTLAAATKSADTAVVFPPYGSTGWKFDATLKNEIDLNATGGAAIQVIGLDLENEFIAVKFKSTLI